MSDDFYTRAAAKIFREYSSLIGRAAVGIARRQDFVRMEDGEISELEGGREELDELVSAYQDTMGEVAIRIAKDALKDVEDFSENEIPDRLS
ncbi:MAG: hypothetical protein ABEK01_00720 [Candidatus Nanohaloarchaea archaeon]